MAENLRRDAVEMLARIRVRHSEIASRRNRDSADCRRWIPISAGHGRLGAGWIKIQPKIDSRVMGNSLVRIRALVVGDSEHIVERPVFEHEYNQMVEIRHLHFPSSFAPRIRAEGFDPGSFG